MTITRRGAAGTPVSEPRPPVRRRPVHYRESDGKPMGETPIHRDEIARLIYTLQDAFASRAGVYVSGDMMFYYEEGNPRAVLSPDVFVAFGTPKLPERRVYLLWLETAPATVFEVTSRSTRARDFTTKRGLYARIGVREYFLYDPLGESRRPALQGYRLANGNYYPITPGPDGSLISETLGMRLLLVEGRLRLFALAAGRELLSPGERAVAEAAHAEAEAARANAETARAEAEAEARRAAEARIAELERLLRERERDRGRDGE